MTTATNQDGAPSRRPRSLLPREHGAWAELGFPALSALLLGSGTLPAALLTLATVAVNLTAGAVLTRWEWSYRILFPVAACFGLASHLVYARIRVRGGTGLPTARRAVPILVRIGSAFTRAFSM